VFSGGPGARLAAAPAAPVALCCARLTPNATAADVLRHLMRCAAPAAAPGPPGERTSDPKKIETSEILVLWPETSQPPPLSARVGR